MSANEPSTLAGAVKSDSSQIGCLRWLHLSDIHFWRKNDWRDDAARRKLITLLREKFADGTLPKPDLIFCTGDIAQGETKPAEMTEQYKSAQGFFDEVLQVCSLPKERLFVVPGNHDVNRTKVSEFTQAGLRSLNHSKVASSWAQKDVGFDDAIKRLNEYGAFVQAYLPHQAQIEDEKARHCYGKLLTINGVRLGIAGFNSAWTCFDEKDQNQLWMAAEWQFNAADRAFDGKTDVRIGLIHHPVSWLKNEEVSLSKSRIRTGFHFWLHGHEHTTWVDPTSREICICAGAVNAGSDDEFAINFVDLDLASGNGKVFLYSYQTAGNVWLKKNLEDAPDAYWNLNFPPLNIAPTPRAALPLSIASNSAQEISQDATPSTGERVAQARSDILALLHEDHFANIPSLSFVEGMPVAIDQVFNNFPNTKELAQLSKQVCFALTEFAQQFAEEFDKLTSDSPLKVEKNKNQFWRRFVNAMQIAILLSAKQKIVPRQRLSLAFNAENPCEIAVMSWLSVSVLMRDDLAKSLRLNQTQQDSMGEQLADSHLGDWSDVEFGTGDKAKIQVYGALKYMLDGGQFPTDPSPLQIEVLQGQLSLRKMQGKEILVVNQHKDKYDKDFIRWLNTEMEVGHVTILSMNGEFELKEGHWRAFLVELLQVLRPFEPPYIRPANPLPRTSV